MESASSDGFIKFNERTYKELVLDNPRPYDVVTFFSVAAHCDHCQDVKAQLDQAVYSFMHSKDKVKRPTFFGSFDYT